MALLRVPLLLPIKKKVRNGHRIYGTKSVGQAGSALRSAAGQYLAAVFVSHSLAETMLLFSVELLGLVRSKHSHLPPFEDNLAS